MLKGGRGSGKSSFVSVELWLTLLRHPNMHAVVLRRVGNTLRSSVFTQLQWAAGALGIEQMCRFTLSPMEAVYEPTGQKILFFGMDDPGKLKSLKVPFGYPGVLWFEELDQFEEEQVRSSAGSNVGPVRRGRDGRFIIRITLRCRQAGWERNFWMTPGF